MSDELSFLRAVSASPDDDTVRLVYADWLEERNDPRAAFLRLEAAARRAGPGGPPALRDALHRSRLGFDARWLALVDRPRPGWPLARTGRDGTTYGRAIPAFIHNFSHHLIGLEVYADGAVECWGYVDLPLFRGKLADGWVVPGAPVGGTVSIHNLGQARALATRWDHTPADLGRLVTEAVRELNPAGDGLLDMRGTALEVRDGMRYAKGGELGRGRPYRPTPEGGVVAGAELPVLEVVGTEYHLRPWLIYADGLSQLGAAGGLEPLEATAGRFEDGRLTLAVPAGGWMVLDGLGRFQAAEGNWYIRPGERVREAADLLGQLNGRHGAIVRCIEAHNAYRADPGSERREALRAAYEAVPEHLRMFCGDMDSKDGPIRRILADRSGGRGGRRR